MGLITSIILWSISLFLTAFGIIFGIIASYNSRKGYKRIKTMIFDSWVFDESQKLFYQNIKSILIENKNLIKKLQNNLSYYDYYIDTTKTKLVNVPPQIVKIILTTNYQTIMNQYLKSKKEFDHKFKQIITNFQMLKTNDLIPAAVAEQLIQYHQEVILAGLNIINQYLLISTNKL